MSLLDNVLTTDISWEDEMMDTAKEQSKRVNRNFKTGSGTKTEKEKIYNIWIKEHQGREILTAKKFAEPLFVESQHLEEVMYEIHCTSEYFDIEFEDAVIISDPKYVRYIQGVEQQNQETGAVIGNDGIDKTKRWELAKRVIKKAFAVKPIKVQNAIDTLLELNLDVPTELTKTIMIQDNYNGNQKVKALTDAFNAIFKDVRHKPTIKIIVRTALK